MFSVLADEHKGQEWLEPTRRLGTLASTSARTHLRLPGALEVPRWKVCVGRQVKAKHA